MIASTLRAGDDIEWTESDSDYPATTHTLKYALRNSGGAIDIASTADGSDHDFTVARATTAAWTPGIYQWTRYVDKIVGATRTTLDKGTIEILPDLVAAATYETRSDVRQIYDAIVAAIKRRATKEQLSVSIAGRAIQYLTMAELINAYHHYKKLVNDEEAAERIAQGLDSGSKILTRFDATS